MITGKSREGLSDIEALLVAARTLGKTAAFFCAAGCLAKGIRCQYLADVRKTHRLFSSSHPATNFCAGTSMPMLVWGRRVLYIFTDSDTAFCDLTNVVNV